MRKLAFLLCLLGLMSGISLAQEQTPYDIALALILEAEASSATELDLSRLGLTELPPEIGNLSDLQVLSLDFNELRHLPSEIGNLTNLQVLGLFNNELSSLPTEIGHLTNLQSLIISFNLLANLPSEIGNLSSLQTLSLDFNELSSLPSEIGNLDNLCILRIQGNQFQHLPTSLAQLSNLEVGYCGLFLSDNPFISPPADVIAQGTPAILDYLENQAWWHFHRLMMSILGGIGFIVLVILGLCYRQRKPKQKRGSV